MKLLRFLQWVVAVVVGWSATSTEAAPDNQSPHLAIVWPRPGDVFSGGVYIKIKAQVSDPDGLIDRVQFFAETNLIGTVTNAPYDVVWRVVPPPPLTGPGGHLSLWAAAVDRQGVTNESKAVQIIWVTGAPWSPVLEITSPRVGALLPAPASFPITAELHASSGDSGPVDFYVGTNLVQRVDRNEPFTASTPPYSITVSNLVEGTYELRAKYMGGDWPECFCRPITISVVKLGVQLPSLTPDGHPQFDVVTSFPGKPVVTEASTNLRDWIPVSTNVPPSNSFHFTDPTTPASSARFYRVVVPPQ